jgi:hypothetical protein
MQPICTLLVASLAFVPDAESSDRFCTGDLRTYVIEVGSSEAPASVDFKVAIGGDGMLQIITATTPFRFEVSAAKIVAMAVAKAEGVKLTMELFVQHKDALESLGWITNASPLILENAACPEVPRAFGRI